ncbi:MULTISPECIES: hypothetical protein [Myroides]|uniref:hypothetical protein n=1 Tax=Myroides TaxID=76831 RepID=UPI0028AB5976|nr:MULTISPECIES: hypothetical protein [Myroides]MDX4974496.1 hypothetical protein [Myroides odoratimimus]
MKALSRIIVLCFFLFHFGFASQRVETGKNYAVSGKVLLSDQVSKKDASKVFCQIEVEYLNSLDTNDFSSDKIDLGDVLHFLHTYVFNERFTTSVLSEDNVSAYLQQHRAKYLLYQTLKIPHGIV